MHHRVPFADVLKSSCDAKGTPLVDGNNRLSGFAQDVLGKCLSHALLFSPSCVFVYENGSPIVWISLEITWDISWKSEKHLPKVCPFSVALPTQ